MTMPRRAGRPRKPAPSRQPKGRASEPTRLQRQEAATAVVKRQRIKNGATNENYTDQAHESPLGRLYLSGALGRGEAATDRYQTGLWFGRLYAHYTRAIGASKPYVGAPSGNGGRAPGSGASEPAINMDDETAQRTVARFNDAIKRVPVLSRDALIQIVVCQHDMPPGLVRVLCPALDALTAHRLTAAPNSHSVSH